MTTQKKARMALVAFWLTALILVGTFGQINPQIGGSTIVTPSGIPTPPISVVETDG